MNEATASNMIHIGGKQKRMRCAFQRWIDCEYQSWNRILKCIFNQFIVGRFIFPFASSQPQSGVFFFLVLMSSFDSANVRCILHIRLSTSCYGSDPERPLYFHYKNESVIKICKHIKQWYLECLNIIMCAHVNVQLLEATIATCNIPTAPLNIRNASESKCR